MGWKINKEEQLDENQALQNVKEKLERMNLKVPNRPLDEKGQPLDPTLPIDLTILTDIQLGKLFSQFCIMAQFSQVKLAVFEVEKAIARQKEKFIRAETRLRRTEGTVSDKDSQVETDTSVRKQVINTLSAEGTEKLTSAILGAYMIGRDACSRELSRRSYALDNNVLKR